jgi:hypothetical protein
MGIQINGTTDTISATDGGLVVSGQQLTGVTNLQISGITTVGAGSTSAPSITPTGDSNTGIFFPTADTIAFVEGGVESARFDSNGRFGLGTSAPSATLDVVAPAGPGATNFRFAAPDNHILSLQRIAPAASPGNLNFQVSTFGAGNINADNTLTLQSGTNTSIVFNTSGANERARLDSSGRLLVGASSSRAVSDSSGNGPQGHIQIESANSGALISIISAGTADAFRAGTLSLGRHRNSTVGGTPTVVQSGDTLGAICFAGGDGTDMLANGASIVCQVDGTPGADDMPGRLVFSTTADGASLPTERMRIAQNGVITIQNGAVAVIGTLTDGATITPDFAADCNFTVTLGGSRTIANPTNITAGQSGSIFIVQDGTGSRTLSWGSSWDFPGGTAPTLTTTANAVDRVDYVVRTSTSIHTVFTANYS